MPGTLLGTGNAVVSKSDTNLYPHSLHFSGGATVKRTIHGLYYIVIIAKKNKINLEREMSRVVGAYLFDGVVREDLSEKLTLGKWPATLR